MAEDWQFETLERYCKSLPTQLGALGDALRQVIGPYPVDRAGLDSALQHTHQMAGSAGTLGFERLSEVLNKLESELLQLKNANEVAFDNHIARVWHLAELVDVVGHAMIPANSSLLREDASDWQTGRASDVSSGSRPGVSNSLDQQRILFVDDDRSMHSLVRSLLISAGVHQVYLAISGKEVIELVDTIKPTLIISDWNMEPISGLELLRQIRGGKTRCPKDVPIIFLTRKNEPEEVHEAMAMGVSHYITKPFKPSALLGAINAVLAQPSQAHRGKQLGNRIVYL